MNRNKRLALAAAAAAAVAAAAAAAASDTVDYTYDALGRLVRVATTGGPNGGTLTSAGYDPAGNRCNFRSSETGAAGPTACAAPPGGGGGGGGTNQPPVAVSDTGSMSNCGPDNFAVLTNDSDPDGNLPLALVSASGDGVRGSAAPNGTSVEFTPNGRIGTATVTYVMRDALGATDSATLTITISDGGCAPQLTTQPDASVEATEEAPPPELPEGGR